jgi:drug/metabolite transporter (DMT)-like permease
MDAYVFLVVLAAAACHAGWNALVKLNVAPLLAICLISAACTVVVMPFMPFVGLPAVASWPYILGSLAVHLVYYTALAEAYRVGDLGQAYPIARGSAPLMTAVGAALMFGENLTPFAWAGVSVLASGILLLALRGGGMLSRFNGRSVGFALLTALSIAAYTLIDGRGARLSVNVSAYIAWLFVLDGFMMLAFGLWWYGAAPLVAVMRTSWVLVMAGGALSTAAYAIAVWAMTVAPIGLVAAVRESSVLFASLLAVFLLKEPVVPIRIASAAIVVLGLALIRLN